MIRVAIAGNPNAGKTSIFNFLTGMCQSVGNYAGVTVEKIQGTAKLGEEQFELVDLPGTYSLTPYSQEEIVARQYIMTESPQVLVDVLDAVNLERNLYLAVQLMELERPMVLALNMLDIARKRGIEIDTEKLGALLGARVVPTVASKGEGLSDLLAACRDAAADPQAPARVDYGHEVEPHVRTLTWALSKHEAVVEQMIPRWAAVKLLEDDDEVITRLADALGADWPAIDAAVQQARASIEEHYQEDAATIIAERRYGYIAGALKQARVAPPLDRRHFSEQIDRVICHRVAGPAILVGVVAALFFFVFKLADEWTWTPMIGEEGFQFGTPTDAMGAIFDAMSGWVGGLEASMPLLHSLIVDGVIAGVGGVMGFVPLIFFMFLFIAALEDSGYIARIAFILDRLLRSFGLQGKSILAMIISGGLGAGGCAVPGVLATRTMREEKDRVITMMVAPFMNCSAKMPVYLMLVAAFFAERQTQMMLLLWALSWVVALAAASVLSKFVLRGAQTPFVLELPPYHTPTWRGALKHAWERTWLYIKKAGTVIMAISIVVWALMNFPQTTADPALSEEQNANIALRNSVAGRIGTSLEPISIWAGFEWRTNIALFGGFMAKEVIISTMGTAYSLGEVDPDESGKLQDRIRADDAWSPLSAFALMVFIMIYAPCLTTVAVIRKETGSWKWPAFALFYATLLGYVLAVIVYQGGLWMGLG